MRALFIRTSKYSGENHPENVRAPLDIGYSAAIYQNGSHEAKVLDMKAEKASREDISELLENYEPDQVFLKTQTQCINVAEDISGMALDSGVDKVFYFGQHPSVSPETFLKDSGDKEFCIRGEIEAVLSDLVSGEGKMNSPEEVEGVVSEEEGIKSSVTRIVKDLDSLPFPEHSGFLNERYGDILPMGINHSKARYGYIVTSRGCPYDCIYCSPTLRISYGKDMRFRSPESVVDEIEMLVEKGVNVIVFKDDIFTISEEHVIGICDEIIERGIDVPWFAQTRADTLSEEVLKKMKDAGCRLVGIGVESGSSRILELLRKGETKEDVREAFRAARKVGINTVGFFMLGNPTETEEEMEMTRKFCRELQPDMIQVAFFTPYPGSEAYNMYSDRMDADFKSFHHYNTVTYNPSKVSTERLSWLQKKFYLSFVFSAGYWKNLFRRKLENPLDFSNEKKYFRRGLNFIFGN